MDATTTTLVQTPDEAVAASIADRIGVPWIRVSPGHHEDTFDLAVRGIEADDMHRVIEAIARVLVLYCRKLPTRTDR